MLGAAHVTVQLAFPNVIFVLIPAELLVHFSSLIIILASVLLLKGPSSKTDGFFFFFAKGIYLKFSDAATTCT